MAKKDKPKKISVKKERYLKFRKEKPQMMFTTPELAEEQVQERRLDEKRIDQFWRYNKRVPERFVNERRARSKR